MSKLLKKVRELLAKGYASDEEKAAIAAMFKELDADEQETVKEDVEKVDALPEESPTPAPEGGNADDAEVAKSVKRIVKAAADLAVAEAKASVEAIKLEVQKWMKEQEALREKKAGIYHPEVQEKRKKLNEYFRKFVSAAIDADVDELCKLNGNISRKELTTDATGTPFGGYVVDSELSAEIRHLITEYGVARREFTSLQLSKNSYKANTLATDITVYWVDEGAAIKSTQPVLSQDSLELKKLATIVAMTRELLEDQEVDLFGFVAGRVAENFAEAEDKAGFVGDGTAAFGGFTGILNDNGVNTVTLPDNSGGGGTDGESFEHLTADDLLDMQDATPSGAMANAKYYMHRTILSIVRKLKDDNGRYIYQEPGGSQPATIWNKPVVLVETMPAIGDDADDTPFIVFGDLKKSSIFGFKGAMSADRFNAGVIRNVADNADINLITTDREAIRWIERVGVLHLLPSAATVLKTRAAS